MSLSIHSEMFLLIHRRPLLYYRAALAHYSVTTPGHGWTWKTIGSGGRKGGKERRNKSRRPKNPALKKGREIKCVSREGLGQGWTSKGPQLD